MNQALLPSSSSGLHDTALAWAEILEALGKSWNPPKIRWPDVWADTERVLAAGHAEAGAWRSSRNPYIIAFQRAAKDWRVQRCTFVCASQVGKTQAVFNFAGSQLDDDPAPVIYFAPTETVIADLLSPEFKQMVRSAPGLMAKLHHGNADKVMHMKFSGVSFRFGWAGSPNLLASAFAKWVIVDEVDKMDPKGGGHGNPIDQAEARTGTFADSCVLITSTPSGGAVDTCTDERSGLVHWRKSEIGADGKALVASPVWREWEAGTRHEWAVPCPDCGEYSVTRADLLKWPEGLGHRETCDRAGVACVHCGSIAGEKWRAWKNARGVYVAPGQRPETYRDDMGTVDDGGTITLTDHTRDGAEDAVPFAGYAMPAEFHTRASFWASGACSFSSKKTYPFLAGKLIGAYKSRDPEKLRAVLNLDFGELYAEGGDRPAWETVRECILGGWDRDWTPGMPAPTGSYLLGELPPGQCGTVLTAGVDVQHKFLAVTVRLWGPAWTSWLVDRYELRGQDAEGNPVDTMRPEAWGMLDDALKQDYGGASVCSVAVDSGDGRRSDQVHDFCRRRQGFAHAMKGRHPVSRPLAPSKPDYTRKGKPDPRGLVVWTHDTHGGKQWIHDRVQWDRTSAPDGAWWLPCDIDEEYCRQIVGKSPFRTAAGRTAWRLHGRAEYLDCEVLSRWAVVIYLNGAQIPAPGAQRSPRRRGWR